MTTKEKTELRQCANNWGFILFEHYFFEKFFPILQVI